MLFSLVGGGLSRLCARVSSKLEGVGALSGFALQYRLTFGALVVFEVLVRVGIDSFREPLSRAPGIKRKVKEAI
jgi:hypothetical protein